MEPENLRHLKNWRIQVFCVDNLPVMLIEKFAEISHDDKLAVDNVAIGIDIRSGEALGQLSLLS